MCKKPTYEELEQRIQELEGTKAERKETDITIQWHEESFKSLLNSIQAAVVVHGADTNIIASNAEAQSLLGSTENQLFGRKAIDPYWKFINTDGEKLPFEMYPVNQVLTHRRVLRDYTLGVCHPGREEIVWVLVNAKPEFNDKDDIEHIVVTFMDITESKKTKHKLQESEERYKALFDNMNNGVAIYSAINNGEDFVFIDFNKAGELIDNIKKNELIGNRVTKMFPMIEEFKLLDVFKRVWKTGNPDTFPVAQYKDNRISGWRENYVYKLPSEELVAVYSDETERKLAEQELYYTKLQLDTILCNIDSPIYIADIESYEILFMNTHMQELFGKDLTGNICWQSLHENMDGPCEFCTNSKLTDADGNPTGPIIWEHYNHILDRWYELHDHAIFWSEGRLVRMEIASDITARKQVDRQQKEINEILDKKVQDRTTNLEEMNSTLTVLLKKRVEDKNTLEKNIFTNYKSLISPLLKKLKNSLTKQKQLILMDIVEFTLEEFLHPFSQKLSNPMVNLTPAEIQIASMIKQGLSNKEMADILNNSVRTITNHRHNIRLKLGITNKKINLRSYLSSL
ncbi:MAG: PAS domain S-box protein [Bacteroidetes bacterium]|nr:PAS domain S-box protein [Bacteroidota bacterium]